MPTNLFIFILNKRWKKLINYLAKYYKFKASIISTSTSSWLKRVSFRRWSDLNSFIFLLTELQVLAKRIGSGVLNLKQITVRDNQLISLQQEESKLLPKKFGPRFKRSSTRMKPKKKHYLNKQKLYTTASSNAKIIYVDHNNQIFTYKFFQKNFFSLSSTKYITGVYLLVFLCRILFLQILVYSRQNIFNVLSIKKI